ncbi:MULTISPECIES: 3-dehydroquinate synthase [unclassified Arenibacter]|uniref:3-dehydroquinate synthase n=1 Tax=unclassified Arenibacter TaxID=2615047 RepID=UPI000E341414|nr:MULTISPECIES: 3-dehydroquinate synthase [unclassified Arenibacter]MCM4163115.1 3-dehydroquinate synthase [Arenibacter sp. A80]RFT57147.1 3-dehydroquinate synthase [Arenibacter sp. P308M17]
MNSITTPSYAVHFNEKAYVALNGHLAKSNYSKIFILVDENTHNCCLPIFMSKIEGEYDFEIVEIEEGEINKNIGTCTQVWEVLSELDADRKSAMINLGGGVVTDLGGFVASCFKRGIDFINVPTTLLSMVDASVGGKTGVDLGPLKNQIGVINQPQIVVVDTDFLNTLNQRQLNSGYAEMLKHGLIVDAAYWETLKAITGFDNLDEYILRSVAIKNEVVQRDPTEQHLRKILNYGHTLGHAVESYFLESKEHELLLHGEAIAIGMILEGYLSHKLTGLNRDALKDIKATFLGRYKKVDFEKKDIDTILSLLKFDKKNSHGNINFVLLKKIGEPVIDIKVAPDLLEEAFAYYAE